MMSSGSRRLPRMAAIVLAVGGLLVFVAGQIHPRGPMNKSFDALEADLLADTGTWDYTHAVLAVAIVVLAAGLFLMLRTDRVRGDRTLRVVTWIAFIGTLISWVEMGFHIAMTSEAAALAAGRPTPLFDTHVVLQAVYTPLLGWGIAAVAARGAATRRWGNWWIAVLGIVGGLAFGLSGPVVAFAPDAHDTLLFIGDAPMGLWAVLSGIQVLWKTRAAAVSVSA